MKIQHLAIIFLLIILPIDIVLGLYLDAQINTIRNKAIFDARLVNSVYDALEVYQSNSLVDTENDIVTSKMSNIEASASTFLTSLQSSFGYSGYKATVMQEYVPAVVYTMYDGYYIYSKFNNTVSQVNVNPYSTYSEAKDESGMGAKTIEGIKSYVFYSCRYKDEGKYDFVVTYSLDNYISIKGLLYDNINNKSFYIEDSGYLMDGITTKLIPGENDKDPNNWSYIYDGIEYSSRSNYEKLEELVGNNEKMYPYVKINGTKYYLDEGDESKPEDDKIFHIINGIRVYYPPYSNQANSEFNKYKNAIKNNKNAYLYYREAYQFTNRVRRKCYLSNTNQYDLSEEDFKRIKLEGDLYRTSGEGSSAKFIIEPKVTENSIIRAYNLGDLKTSNAFIDDRISTKTIKDDKKAGYKIFAKDSSVDNSSIGEANKLYIQDSNSNFNRHRSAVIRNSIETNLSAAIAGFSEFSDELEFAMPKISETDWEMIENNVSVIGFLQGLDMGTKKYNGYAAVANTTTTEFVDENAIYLIAKDKNQDTSYQYYRSNATDLPNLPDGFQGIFKIDFERHYIKNDDGTTTYYYPKSPSNLETYSASYSSIINQTAVDTQYDDMYKYMRNLSDTKVKEAYYTALGRERFSSYKVSHDTDYSYFLKYY